MEILKFLEFLELVLMISKCAHVIQENMVPLLLGSKGKNG